MKELLELISIMLFGVPPEETEAKCDFSGLWKALDKASCVAYPATKLFRQ